MPLARELLAKNIHSMLLSLAEELKGLTRNSLTDGSKVLEVVMQRFLNALHGWELADLNQNRANYPAADLGDRHRRIAVQVTNRDDAEKIKDTRTKALDPKHDLGREFDTLYVLFFIPTRKPSPTKNLLQPTDRPQIEIWDLSDLLKQMLQAEIEHLRAAQAVLEREMTRHQFGASPAKVLWPTKLRHTAERLVGREDELAMLQQAWDNRETNVLVIRGKGGEGKTALVAAWMAELAAKDWRGAERVLDWSFYSQGTREQATATSEVFIHEALVRLGDPTPNEGDAAARAGRLAKLIGEQRCLMVLDGLEPLQYPPGPLNGALKDPGMAALLRGLVSRNDGLCVITTREKVDEIRQHYGKSAVDHELKFLSPLAGAQLLRNSGARRAGARAIAADDRELQDASKEVRGHALTLSLIGQYLRLTAGGDIRQRDRMKLADADKEYTNDATRPYGHAFKAIEAYERWFVDGDAGARRQLAILRLLGIFDRPAPAACLAALREGKPILGLTDVWAGASTKDWSIALSRLQEINLISVGEDDSVDCHPLLREYFAARLKEQNPAAFRAAHSRLFDHLCETTDQQPDTLPGLQPLYQAVTHGCLAGRQQEACEKVYRDRILRGTDHDGFYSSRTLGAIGGNLGAVAAFFDEPWTRLLPSLSAPCQSWLFNEAAFYLRALGRLTEAVEPMQVGLDLRVVDEDWQQAAVSASNLAELRLTLGRLGEAVADGRHAIDFADRCGDAFQKLGLLTTAADALHQAGDRARAGELFAEAERVQKALQPQIQILYSVPGFRYADLLLAPAERAAWLVVLARAGVLPAQPGVSPGGASPQLQATTLHEGGDVAGRSVPRDDETGRQDASAPQDPLDACAEAERRAGEAQRVWQELFTNAPSLLIVALEHLTQARAGLYRAVLSLEANFVLRTSNGEIDTALAKLRVASRADYLPKALLTGALYHGTLGSDPATCARLLDEAQQIAERGPMPLYLADVHLHRARLAAAMKQEHRNQHFPGVDPKTELAKARALIEKHMYWRRREELADAQQAAVHW